MKNTTSDSEPFLKVEIFKNGVDRKAFVEQTIPQLHPGTYIPFFTISCIYSFYVGEQVPFPLTRETMESLVRLREYFPHDFKVSDLTYKFSEAEIKNAVKRKTTDAPSLEEGEQDADDEESEADAEAKSQLTRSLAKVSEISNKAPYFSSKEYKDEKKDRASQLDLAADSVSGLLRRLIDATTDATTLKRGAEKEPEVEPQEQRPTKKKRTNEDANTLSNELPQKSEEKEKKATRKATREAEEAETKRIRDEKEAQRKQSQQSLRATLKKSGHYKL